MTGFVNEKVRKNRVVEDGTYQKAEKAVFGSRFTWRRARDTTPSAIPVRKTMAVATGLRVVNLAMGI